MRWICSISFIICIALRCEAQIWDGHVAFSEGRYDDAIALYQQAIDEGSTWDWLPELIETAEVRQSLGNVSADHVHHIGVIFVTELNEIQEDGTVITTADVSEEQKEEWLVNFYLMKEVIEGFSNGGWTLQIDTASAVSTYHTGAELKPDNPDHLNLESHFFLSMADIDSYITVSNTRSPARGLARKYPIINGAVYGPHRGMAAVNAGTHGFSVLIHEFFHIVEWVSNAIEVTHGYYEENRHHFPEWTGTTEFDYYRWHFTATLPDAGWELMQHRHRWIPYHWSEDAHQTILEAMNGILLQTRRKGVDLYDSARALKNDDPEGAIALMEEAIQMNPYHPDILLELLEYYRQEEPDTEKSLLYESRFNEIRDAGAWYWVTDETAALGSVVGMWHPEDMSVDDPFFTFDVTNEVTSPGRYDVAFYYLEGWNGAEIDSVYILEGDIVVASDIHHGQSGNAKNDHIYSLNLLEYDPEASYFLKARITPWGNGTDSKGQIHFTLKEPFEITYAENQHQVAIYPNPSNGTIKFTNPSNIRQLIVYSTRGEVLWTLSHFDLKEFADLSHLASGLYHIRYLEGNQWKYVKWIRK